jgi:hypothetical protein
LLSVLETVFTSAATPQKCLFVALALAIPSAPLLALMARYDHDRPWRRVLDELRQAAPLLGMMMGGMNSFHMARTILKLPNLLTVKQIAPGILEVSTFVVMGVLVGLIAQACLIAVDARTAGAR